MPSNATWFRQQVPTCRQMRHGFGNILIKEYLAGTKVLSDFCDIIRYKPFVVVLSGQSGSKSGLGTNRWQYLSFYDYGTSKASQRLNSRYWFGEDINNRITSIEVSQLGNTSLSWATVTKQNIGVDFGLFKNKISGEVDFFKDSRVDLINRIQTVPGYFGSDAALPFANIGESESHGVDISLTYKNTTSYGLKYSITGGYGFYENRILVRTLSTIPLHQNSSISFFSICRRRGGKGASKILFSSRLPSFG